MTRVLALVLGMVLMSSEGSGDNASVDSARASRGYVWTQSQRALSIGVNSDFDLELLDPHGKLLRFGKGVADAEWRNGFGSAVDHGAPGRITQIHLSNPSSGTWKLRVAVDVDMKVLSVDAFSNGGCSANDFVAPMRRDRAQWWKLKLSWNATRDTCSMKLVRWKQERIKP